MTLHHRQQPSRPREPRLPGARPDRERAADARTLYLAASERLRVTSTGEALVIARDSGSVQRIPITRLLRIVCNTRAEWSGAALALCMERGVPVSWLGHDDAAIGHLWPRRPHPAPLAEVLDALAADHPGWAEAYDHWLRRRRLQVLKDWAGAREAAGHVVGADEWQLAKQAWVYRAEPCEVLPPVLHGMAAALVAAQMSAQGLPSHCWCSVGEPIALADDITRLVWAGMNLNAGALAAAIDHPREAAALFERWTPTCDAVIHGHLASLHGHARRELAL
jgi:hypothetical protein